MNLDGDGNKGRHARSIFGMAVLSALLSVDAVGAFSSWSPATRAFSATSVSSLSFHDVTLPPSIMMVPKVSTTKLTSTLESTGESKPANVLQKAVEKFKARPRACLTALAIVGFVVCGLTNSLFSSSLSRGSSMDVLLALRGGEAVCPPI